jgi:hypothetical protein
VLSLGSGEEERQHSRRMQPIRRVFVG